MGEAWALLLAGQSGWPVTRPSQDEVPQGRAQLDRLFWSLGPTDRPRRWLGPVPRAACTAARVPRPEQRLVSARAQQSALPALLPYAIMVAESGLDPAVTSPAGARGLMQLMPEVGGELHALLYPERAYSPDLLYQPGYNASLGTSELGRLWTRFSAADRSPEATLAMVIAGYNAGPEAVERWLAVSPAGPLDPAVFMENIGYTETRRYLRRVLGYLSATRISTEPR